MAAREGYIFAGWREQHELTQRQAAQITGVDPNTWARWERNEREAPAPVLRLLATLSRLWHYEPDWYRPSILPTAPAPPPSAPIDQGCEFCGAELDIPVVASVKRNGRTMGTREFCSLDHLNRYVMGEALAK